MEVIPNGLYKMDSGSLINKVSGGIPFILTYHKGRIYPHTVNNGRIYPHTVNNGRIYPHTVKYRAEFTRIPLNNGRIYPHTVNKGRIYPHNVK